MTYILLDEKEDSLIIENNRLGGIKVPIGELLFSFLELDLKEYTSLYELVNSRNDIEYKDVAELFEKYPKTARKYKSLSKRGFLSEDKIVEYEFEVEDYLLGVAIYFLTENEDTFQDIYAHPYVEFSESMLMLGACELDSIIYDMDFINIQLKTQELIDFCLLKSSRDDINNLTSMERYYLFLTLKKRSHEYEILVHKTIFTAPSTLSAEIKQLYSEETQDSDLDVSLIPSNIVERIKGNSRIFEVITCKTLEDFAIYEFNVLLSSKQVKRCSNCNKLFVISGNYNTDCCDRIADGEKYSCKKIMAMRKRKEKVNRNPIVKEYEKAYKRNYARVSNQKMTHEDFRLWVDESTLKRDGATRQYESNPSDQIIDDFKKYLGNK